VFYRTEHPERYNPRILRAQVLDHDPQVVLRRIWPAKGEPFHEQVRHSIRERKVETWRHGASWCVRQRIEVADENATLIYEVTDHHAAADHAGITAAHATRTLGALLGSAQAKEASQGHRVIEPRPHGRAPIGDLETA